MLKCNQCQHENPNGKTVCENCGQQIMFVRKIENTDEKSQAISYLLVYLFWGLFISFLYMFVAVARKMALINYDTMDFYKYLNWVIEIVNFILLTVFIILTKYDKVKIAFVILLVLKIAIFALNKLVFDY